jgi:hypothetical protein
MLLVVQPHLVSVQPYLLASLPLLLSPLLLLVVLLLLSILEDQAPLNHCPTSPAFFVSSLRNYNYSLRSQQVPYRSKRIEQRYNDSVANMCAMFHL